METKAFFSQCRNYRYYLSRTWSIDKPRLGFIMLNPSTADENVDDPTILRCIDFGKRLGYGSVHVVNLFALRATQPSELLISPFPESEPEALTANDTAIGFTMARVSRVICAWGNPRYANIGNRQAMVLKCLRGAGMDPHALSLNKDGTPGHPLYLKNDLVPVPL